MKTVITGATSGIGLELSRILCREHEAKIIGVGRNTEKLLQVRNELGDCFYPVTADLSRLESINEIYVKSKTILGELDLLVNNAGFGIYKDVLEHSDEEILSLAIVNFVAPLILTKKMLPLMKENSTVIFVITAGIHVLMQQLPVYGATKAGLHYAVKALRRELNKRKINVLTVYPGVVKTSFHSRAGGDVDKGLSPEHVAFEIVKAINKRKKEIYVPRYLSLSKILTYFLPPVKIPARRKSS
ncbi:MAG: SDR family NAD(P)-dependent oxidoreductase [Desulfurococcaceae archaeon]